MPPPIARMYSSRESADSAAESLRAQRVSAGTVHVVAPPPAPEGDAPAVPQSEHASLASVLATGISPSVAAIYAEGLRKGETLVTVHPLLGRSLKAKSILQSFGPTATVAPDVSVEPADAAEAAPSGRDCCAAPLSTALGWPVLSSDPTPLSNYLKWPVLSPRRPSSKTLAKIRQQSNDPAPFSKKIGMRVLSGNPAPLSSLLKWKVRSDSPAPLSTRFGWRLLIDNPTPFSSWLGWRVLSKSKRRPVRYVRYL